MKYVSIDIETSGLDPEKHKVLSFGAIIEDTNNIKSFEELPKFNCVLLQREIVGSPTALRINAELIESMSRYLEGDEYLKLEIQKSLNTQFLEEYELSERFQEFLLQNGHPINTAINVAGKNFGTFDNLFLKRIPKWVKLIRTRQRILDPSILYCDWSNDETLPNLSECKKRAVMNDYVSHTALDDAWDVIQVLRKFYYQNEIS
jgi:oligoribonuclease (3'-5' exoribonuclease)